MKKMKPCFVAASACLILNLDASAKDLASDFGELQEQVTTWKDVRSQGEIGTQDKAAPTYEEVAAKFKDLARPAAIDELEGRWRLEFIAAETGVRYSPAGFRGGDAWSSGESRLVVLKQEKVTGNPYVPKTASFKVSEEDFTNLKIVPDQVHDTGGASVTLPSKAPSSFATERKFRAGSYSTRDYEVRTGEGGRLLCKVTVKTYNVVNTGTYVRYLGFAKISD